MPKAHADNRNVGGIGPAQKILQRRNPRMVLIGAMPRAGDQPAIGILRRGWYLSVDHSPRLESKPLPIKQRAEHRAEIAMLVLQVIGQMAGL